MERCCYCKNYRSTICQEPSQELPLARFGLQHSLNSRMPTKKVSAICHDIWYWIQRSNCFNLQFSILSAFQSVLIVLIVVVRNECFNSNRQVHATLRNQAERGLQLMLMPISAFQNFVKSSA